MKMYCELTCGDL